MAPTFEELFAGATQGAADVARAGLADVQNKYQEFLTGRPAPMTAPVGDMTYTVSAQDAAPESYEAALRTYSDAEQAEVRATYDAARTASAGGSAPAQEPPVHEPEL